MISAQCKKMNLACINDADYKDRCVGCLVLSQDMRLVLQLRDGSAPTFPHYLATFGGSIEDDETPMETLVRELKEELGAVVNARDVVTLGALTAPETNYQQLMFAYFWHDIYGTITGCYEGSAKYYNDPVTPQQHPKVMRDVIWMIQECNKRGLLK